jgi:hypothetical protein
MPTKSTRVKVAGGRQPDAPFFWRSADGIIELRGVRRDISEIGVKRSELTWIARRLATAAPRGVEIGQSRESVRQRALLHSCVTSGE